jgi:hypothetical protein
MTSLYVIPIITVFPSSVSSTTGSGISSRYSPAGSACIISFSGSRILFSFATLNPFSTVFGCRRLWNWNS